MKAVKIVTLILAILFGLIAAVAERFAVQFIAMAIMFISFEIWIKIIKNERRQKSLQSKDIK